MPRDSAAILQRIIQAANAAGHPLTPAQIEQWRIFANAINAARDAAVAQRDAARAEKDRRSEARIKDLEERLMQREAERRAAASPPKLSGVSEPSAPPPSVPKEKLQ